MDQLQKILIEEIGLSKRHWDQLKRVLKTVNFSKKDHFLTEGNTCEHIGFVKNGLLRSYLHKDGDEFNLDFYFPGSIVSAYKSFLNQSPTNANFQALSDTTIYTISYTEFYNLLNQSNDWFKFGKYISDTLFEKKCTRESSLLINSAKERYKLLLETYPNIEQHIPQYHIALYLGIKPESLSRIKSLTYLNES